MKLIRFERKKGIERQEKSLGYFNFQAEKITVSDKNGKLRREAIVVRSLSLNFPFIFQVFHSGRMSLKVYQWNIKCPFKMSS